MAMGRPRKEIDKTAFENLCGLQCSLDEVCSFFDVSKKTLEAWCKRTYDCTFSTIFSEKRVKGKISLRRAQMRLAEKNAAMAIFLGKNILGQSDKSRGDLNEQEARIAILEAQLLDIKEKAELRRADTSDDDLIDPHDIIIPALCEIYDDEEHEHQIITSGRAGTKSSCMAIKAIDMIWNDEPAAVVILRKRHNKLRKTVYKEAKRAIGRLGLKKKDFEINVSPMQIRCRKNGNVIYFSGSDSVDDTKGIIDEDKPIKMVVLDELTEFFDAGDGEDEITNIEATFVRGNDDFFRMLYLYNPPKNPNAPVNKWCDKMETREDAIHAHVDYRDVPVQWIGQKLIDSAERMREHDLKHYRWLWLGEKVGIDETIYYMFTPDHIKRPEEKRYAIIVGGDYGQMNATTFQAFGLDVSARKFRGLGEYYYSGRENGTQKSPSDYADDFEKWITGLNEKYGNGIIYLYLDPSAKGLGEEIRRKAPFVHLVYADNSVELGISRVQKILGYNVMSISPNQDHAVDEFGTYSYDKKSIENGREVPVKVNDHCMDAIRYAVMGVWSKLKYFLPEAEREE